MMPATTAPAIPSGLLYGRDAFGNFRRRITNDTICSRYESTAPQIAMFSTIAPAGLAEPPVASTTTRAMNPMTAPTISATYGVWRLPVSESAFG